jgi:predicted Zn finger-like uncharacterized protein
MKIFCPQCRTAYELAAGVLGSSGRSVRCARCQTVWFAGPAAPAGEMLGNAGGDAPPSITPNAPAPAAELTAAAASPPEVLAFAAEAETGASASAVGAAPETEPAAATPEALALVEPVGDEPPAATSAAGPAIEDDAPELTSADIESIAARRAKARPVSRRRAKPAWRFSWIAAAIAALVAVDAGLIIWRTDVVRLLPQTASLFERLGLPVNLRGLAFKDVHTAYEEQDGVSILVVDGTIAATGRKVADVPRLRFAIEAGNGHEIYAWTALPTRSRLAPGESLPFRSRLASPPEQGRRMNVRFFNRQDLASGLR